MEGSKAKAIGVIPARYGSTRFPGKPLALILGKPMIYWVYSRASQAQLLDRLVVATDDERILEAVRAFGGEAVMTSPEHPTGTDRLAEVARSVVAEIFVNIQGDEPLISPEAIDALIRAMQEHPDVPMGTLCRKASDPEEVGNPNTARVVFDRDHRALYFSRAAIPYYREAGSPAQFLDFGPVYQHIGVYAYRRDFLLRFTELPQTPLEKAEKLEQLRALEHGFPIFVVETDYQPICVDVPADIAKVENRMKEQGVTHAERLFT